MGVDVAIFESAGQRTEHVVPGVYSRSANVTSPAGTSANNHVIMGRCSGGIPKKLQTFSSLTEAQDVLMNGELLTAVAFAFNGSPTYIPSQVHVMRVNDGTPSEVTIGSIKMISNIYSSKGNLLKAKIELGSAGSNTRKLTIVKNDKEFVVDNITRPSLSITGPSGAACKVDVDKLTLKYGDKTEEFDFDTYDTVSELASRINDIDEFTCTLEDFTTGIKAKELDCLDETRCDDSLTLYSNTQAIIETAKKMEVISDAMLAATDRKVPNPNSDYSYFTGGSEGAYDVAEWQKALEVLETENIQIISTPSTDYSVQTLISNHCQQMNKTEARKERTCFVGATLNASDEEILTNAKGLNSKFTSYVADTISVINPITGVKENVPGSILAVMLGAMESAMAINEPLTSKEIKCLGFAKKRTVPNMTKLIQGGVIVCNPNPDNDSLNVVIRGVTTFQGRGDLISCERSMVREDLYMNRDLRSRFTVGGPNKDSTDEIVQTLRDAADEWETQGYIIAGENGKVWNISVRIDGDKVYLTYSRYLTAPRNFVFITANNHVYTSTQQL